MSAKTNAARMLDRADVHYELREYTVDEEDLSAPHVAEAVGLPPEQVFKTLVVRGDRTGVLLACIPGNGELDLKALATASGNKRVELVPLKEVLGLTGYVRGGVSPVGTRKPYPVFLDETAELWGHDCRECRDARLPDAGGAGGAGACGGSAEGRLREVGQAKGRGMLRLARTIISARRSGPRT